MSGIRDCKSATFALLQMRHSKILLAIFGKVREIREGPPRAEGYPCKTVNVTVLQVGSPTCRGIPLGSGTRVPFAEWLRDCIILTWGNYDTERKTIDRRGSKT
jgi:hypothetical protein